MPVIGFLKRKKPVLLVLTITALTIYWFANYNHQERLLRDNYVRNTIYKERYMIGYAKFAHAFGEKEEWEELEARLEDALAYDFFDFYILQYDGTTVFKKSDENKIEGIERDYKVLNRPLFANSLSFITVEPKPKFKLTLGVLNDPEKYVSEKMNDQRIRDLLYEEAVYYVMIILFVALWTFRDYFAILRRVRSGKASDLKSVKANSAEGDLILRGFHGFAQTVEWLESENVLLNRQVLPSLKKEILSGKKPPYDFHCSLVRTDINNFSTIYNTHDVTKFMKTINEFFIDVSHVVARYKGLVHEFVGDEVIYYFKDEDHPNSFLIALSAIRDINEIAKKYNEKTLKEDGYPFTVKSSVAHGKVRFGPLVNGFTVAGSVLIETVRILSHVVEKEENAIVFDQVHAGGLEGLIGSKELTKVKLKGFADEKTLMSYQGHVSIDFLLMNLNERTVRHLACYRSDQDMFASLSYLRKSAAQMPETLLQSALSVMRNISVTKTDVDWGSFLCDWMDDTHAQLRDTNDQKWVRLLSSIPMLHLNLVPNDELPVAVEQRLKAYMKLGEERVTANVIEVLTEFESVDRSRIVRQLQSDSSYRTTANAFIHDGMIELNAKVIKGLRQLLESPDPNSIAAGLYAIGELAFRHRERDLVFYSTQVRFLDLVHKIPEFALSPESAIRKQAYIAARKSADEKVIQSIRDQVMSAASETLAIEVDRYLDPTDDSKNKKVA